MTPEELDHVAATFVLYARTSVSDRFEGLETSRMNLESLIDNCSDHNQLMLDSIEDVAPEVRVALEELLLSDSEDDVKAWTEFVNDLFERARKIIAELIEP